MGKKDKQSKRPRVIPTPLMDRAGLHPKLGDREWFNARRKARPATSRITPAGGVALPKDLMKGAEKLAHQSFVPPEAELFQLPRLVAPPERPPLRRFSGRRVIPANNQTFLDGNDDRKLYYDTSYPWCCIGRVATKSGWGSGTIVGENFVLTASHVVAGLWTANQPLTESITFTPAQFGSSSILGPTWTTKVVGIAAWQEIDAVVGYDMALLQLEEPLGDWLGYFGSRGFDSGWKDHAWWEHAGYPFDLSSNGTDPSYQFSITINDDDSDNFDTVELETDADIASGQSGGPLWAIFQDGGHQIIGVLSGHESGNETTNIFAGGNGLNSLVKWGRDNWK
jgi:V8-like Glu-specific endopeptidase